MLWSNQFGKYFFHPYQEGGSVAICIYVGQKIVYICYVFSELLNPPHFCYNIVQSDWTIWTSAEPSPLYWWDNVNWTDQAIKCRYLKCFVTYTCSRGWEKLYQISRACHISETVGFQWSRVCGKIPCKEKDEVLHLASSVTEKEAQYLVDFVSCHPILYLEMLFWPICWIGIWLSCAKILAVKDVQCLQSFLSSINRQLSSCLVLSYHFCIELWLCPHSHLQVSYIWGCPMKARENYFAFSVPCHNMTTHKTFSCFVYLGAPTLWIHSHSFLSLWFCSLVATFGFPNGGSRGRPVGPYD